MHVRYPSVDDLCSIIHRKCGKGKVKLFKWDLRKAYRQLWMSPESIMWLGFTFENKIYFDVTLSMGSRSAAYCCQRVTNAVTYLYQQEGYDNVNYLDNLGTAEIEQEANTAFKVLGLLLREIGIEESIAKACPPHS